MSDTNPRGYWANKYRLYERGDIPIKDKIHLVEYSAFDAKCAELSAARNLTALAHGINKDLKAKIKRMKDAVDNEVTCADCVEAIGDGYTMCGDCSCE